MQAVSFDPTGSGRRDHVAFVGVSGKDKNGYMWVIDTTKGTDSDCSGLVAIGDFSYMFDAGTFKVPTYSNRSFLNIVAGDFDGDGKESIVVYTPEQTLGIRQAAVRFRNGTTMAAIRRSPNAARATAC